MTATSKHKSEPKTEPKQKLTGARILWECLEREGVTHAFGYPGGAILPAYDALKHSKIHHVLVRHEQGAAHMADGYARASGQVGVAIATSGPGATNLVTGIATAMLDSSPIVCITGQVGSKLIGSDAFQEVDITGITLPVTNFTQLKKMAATCGASIPDWMAGHFEGLDDDPDTRRLVAASLAAEQCRRLHANGVHEFHFYTLNRADLTVAICHLLGVRAKKPAVAVA